jgi:ankyrin repeat protein
VSGADSTGLCRGDGTNYGSRFLLAQLQMDSVAKKNNRRGIRRSLASLPQKLNDTYEQAMRRIWSQSQEDIDLAEQLLSWIVCAKRPLKLIEVQHALAVEEGDVDLDEEGIPDEDLMISACAGLVTADRESTVIRLVHHTAQEYFEQILATRFPRAQINITSTCLTYLSFDALDAKGGRANELKDLLEHYPLAEYAVQFWGEHARGGPELSLEESITTFLKNGSKAAVWYRISRYLRQGYDNPSSHATGLHIASGFGLSRIVRSLISASNIDVNTRDSSGLTPLHWAARDGQEAGVKELLKYPNAIADASSYRGLTPLFLAAANGHVGVVSRLLQRQDIDVDVKDSNFGQSPLWKAVDGGHVAVVQLLLGHPNVTVNSRNRPWGQTPLWRAAEHGHTAIVRLLLQRPEVDANAADSNYAQTPLQRATENGHTAVVELLRRHSGIDVVSTDRPFTTSSTLSIDGAVHISYSLVTAL